MNGETPIQVTDVAACAEECLEYSEDLCKSFATSPSTTGTNCILFAYTVAQLDVQPEPSPYGPGPAFYDSACYAFDCSS